LIQRERVLGVLDLDSPLVGRFDDDDAAGLKSVVDLFVECSDLDRYVD
jgi:GAF domain-containing protein